jgi:hypothetical protein
MKATVSTLGRRPKRKASNLFTVDGARSIRLARMLNSEQHDRRADRSTFG